jgi:hypothetical protein
MSHGTVCGISVGLLESQKWATFPASGSAFGPQNGYPDLWSLLSSTLKQVPQVITCLISRVLYNAIPCTDVRISRRFTASFERTVGKYIKFTFAFSGMLKFRVWAGIAQSVQLLATGWTVRGSNPGGGEIFCTRPHRPWGPPSLLYDGYRAFPGGESAGVWRWPPTPI